MLIYAEMYGIPHYLHVCEPDNTEI